MTKKNQKTVEQTIVERRAEIAKRMHVAKMGDGFHIIEIPAADGSPFEAWPGPFNSKLAAELFRDDLLDAYAEGNPNNACMSGGIFQEFEQRAGVLNFLETQVGIADPRALAASLCQDRPWLGLGAREMAEIPF